MDLNSICIDCFKNTGGEDICMNCGFQQSSGLMLDATIGILPARTALNKYVIGRVINISDDSIIYKAYDMNLERIVAIKEFFPHQSGLAARGEDGFSVLTNDSDTFNARKNDFILYAQTIRNSGHDNIVSFYEEFEDNGTAYHVMEFIEGVSLEQYFEQVNKLSFEEALDVMMPIMEAVEALHASDILLKSLSPKNIFITVSGDIKLGGFSDIIVSDFMSQAQKEGSRNEYSSPETYVSSKETKSSAIYSLGAVWYKILSGVTPERADLRMKKDKLQHFSKIGIEVPGFVEAVVFKAMSLKEKDRFATVTDFIASIRGEGWQPRQKINKLQVFLSVAAVFVVLLIIAGVGVYFVSSNSIVPMKNAEITLWYPDSGDKKVNARWDTVAENFKTYSEGQKKIGKLDLTLNVVAVPEKKYASELKKAFEEGNAPDIYDSGYLEEDNHAYSLEELYSQLEKEDETLSSAFDQMKSLFEGSNKIAVTYDVPVLYVSTRGTSYIPTENDSLSFLQNYTEDAERFFSDPFVCNPETALYAAYAYGYEDGKDTSVLKSLYDDSRLCDYDKKWKPSDIVFSSTKYYLGFVSEYNDFYSDCFGKFEMVPLTGADVKHSCVYPEVWSVNNASSDEEIKASVFLLYYLINTMEGQRTVSSVDGNTYYIPFRQSLVDEVTSIDGAYEKVVNTSYSGLTESAAQYAFITEKAEKLGKIAIKANSTENDFNEVAKLTNN